MAIQKTTSSDYDGQVLLWVGLVWPLRIKAAGTWAAPGSPLPSAVLRESILVLILFIMLVLALRGSSSVNTNGTPDCFK